MPVAVNLFAFMIYAPMKMKTKIKFQVPRLLHFLRAFLGDGSQTILEFKASRLGSSGKETDEKFYSVEFTFQFKLIF